MGIHVISFSFRRRRRRRGWAARASQLATMSSQSADSMPSTQLHELLAHSHTLTQSLSHSVSHSLTHSLTPTPSHSVMTLAGESSTVQRSKRGSAECGVRCAVCGVRCAVGGEQSAECGVWSVAAGSLTHSLLVRSFVR